MSAKFPGSIATDADLLVAKDRSSSALTAGIDASTLSVPVVDGTKFIADEIVTIDDEQMQVASIAGNTLTIRAGTRGWDWTVPATHSDGAAVRGQVTAYHHNAPSEEIKAIETALGANLANVVKGAAGLVTAGRLARTTSTGTVADSTGIFEDAAGNVGIGTTGPGTQLDVVAPTAADGIRSIGSVALGTGSGGGFLGATPNIPTAANQRLGIVAFGGISTGSTYVYAARMSGFSSEAWGAEATGSYLIFQTVLTGTVLTAERMRIDDAGNVGIGTSVPTSKLQVVGLPSYADNAAAVAGGLTAGAFYLVTGSDPRQVAAVF